MKRVGLAVGLAMVLAVAMALAACKPPPKATSPLPPVQTAPLVPRADLFGNPERAQARISPKGDYVAFLAPDNGYLNVFVMGATEAVTAARPVTADVNRGIRRFAWAKNGAQILYLQDLAGDENWRLFAVDIATGATRDLTPLPGVQAQIVGMSAREPDEVLVSLNDRDPRWHDVYKINILTGKRTLLVRNTRQFSDFLADQNNVVRLALRNTPSGVVEIWNAGTGGAWTKASEIKFEDSQTTMPLSFEGDGATYLMLDSSNRDKAALVRVDVATGAKTVLGESARADVSDVWIDPRDFHPTAYSAEYLKREWSHLDPAAKADLEFLKANVKGETSVVSRSDDDMKWIVVEDGPTTPATAYLYDRAATRLTRLFDSRPALAKAALTPMIPVELKSRDGLTLVSYLTLPPGSDADGNGIPDKPVPMVLEVHGGPWARDSYGFDPTHQWLASRGYAVLSVNFRGSTGFGKAFVNAGDKEWAGKMHEDLIDAAEWAISHGVTDKDHIGIFGGSYGGYAALVGLTFTPDTFACGVSLVGPSNLETLLTSLPPYWESAKSEFYLRVGDPRTEQGRKLLSDRSPLYKAGQIMRPLLIAHGANDPRVKQAESDQIVAAMKERKIPVTYLLYPDEGHGFGRPQNRLSFYAAAEGFLAKCLGGRSQAIGADLQGANLTVKEGADLVPGLEDALQALAPPPAPPPTQPPADAPALRP